MWMWVCVRAHPRSERVANELARALRVLSTDAGADKVECTRAASLTWMTVSADVLALAMLSADEVQHSCTASLMCAVVSNC
eukprot:1149683-Pelagomonas_calceolata.AAC.11